MKNSLRLTIYIGLISIFSCSKGIDLEINTPKVKPSMVIHSELTPFSLPKVFQLVVEIQSSTYINDSVTKKSLRNALVIIKRNLTIIDTLNYCDTSKVYLITENITDYPKAGDQYELKVIKEGFETVKTNTIIPEKVEIIETEINPLAFLDHESQPQSEATIQFRDPVDEHNYYEVIVSDNTELEETYYELSSNNKLITSESYYPSAFEFDKPKPKSLLFSDKMINGEIVNLNVFYPAPYIIDGGIPLIPFHYITLHLRNVSKEYYKYKTTILQHLYSLDENILYGTGEPIPIYSNIKNGYGLFGSYNTSIASHRFEKIIIE